VCLAIAVTGLVWFTLIIPILPPTRWIRYLLTPVGVVFLYSVAEIVISKLFTDPIVGSIKGEHPVLKRAGHTEER
jgi:hypothetical protein